MTKYVQISCAECGADLPPVKIKLSVDSQFGQTVIEFCCAGCRAAYEERLKR